MPPASSPTGPRRSRRSTSSAIPIALDDFGTHHSSLSYLQLLPVRHLEIDRGQGYLFGRPMPWQELTELLRDGPHPAA